LPLYEYACTQCGQHTEKIQKFSDAPLTKCKKCGGTLKRLLSAPAIQFKGSGWYVTDYARRSTTPASSSTDSGNDGKGHGSAGTKQEPTAKKKEDKPVAGKTP